MPIFEFVCLNCERSFDKLMRSSSAISDVNCPTCESKNIRKKLSLFSRKISGGAAVASTSAGCAPGGL
jgi:putative FmdB family regulatory protein